MTVLFLCAYNAISGGTIMIFEHAHRLRKEGINARVTFKFVNKEIPFSVFPHSDSVPIIDYDAAKKQDVVVATYWSTVYDLSEFNATYFLYFSQCDERLFYPESDPNRFWVEQTLGIKWLPVITPAKFLTRRYKEEFGTNSYYVPYGIDTTLFNPDGRKENKKIRVLIEGAGKARIKRVADAFEVVKDVEGIEVWYATYDGYVEAHWHADQVFRGVPFDEMPSIYRKCDILLKLSEVESFGLPNLEMMACGGAVITSNFTGHEEYVIDGVNALVVDIGDVETARKKLLQLIKDKKLRDTIQSSGIQTAARRDWNTVSPAYHSVLNEVLTAYPDGNKHQVIGPLRNMKIGYAHHLKRCLEAEYLSSWRETIRKREKKLVYRFASKFNKLFGG